MTAALRDPISLAILSGSIGTIAFLLKKNAFFVDTNQLALVYSPTAGLQQTVFFPGWHMSTRWFRGDEIVYFSNVTHSYHLPRIDISVEMPLKKAPDVHGEAPIMTYGSEDRPVFKIAAKVVSGDEEIIPSSSSSSSSSDVEKKYLGSMSVKVNFRPEGKKTADLYRTYGSDDMYPDRTVPPLMETCVAAALTDLLGRPPASQTVGDNVSFTRAEYDLNLSKDLHTSHGQFFEVKSDKEGGIISSSEASAAKGLLMDYSKRERKLYDYYEIAAKASNGEEGPSGKLPKLPTPPPPLSATSVEKVASSNFKAMKSRYENEFKNKDLSERFLREELMGKCNLVSQKGKNPFYLDVRQVMVEGIKV